MNIKLNEVFEVVKQDYVYTIDELLDSVEKIKIGKKVNQNKDCTDWSLPLLLNSKPIRFITPEVTYLFGIVKYKNKIVSKEQPEKLSVHISIDDSNEDIYKLHVLLDYIDMIAYQSIYGSHNNKIYHSALRPNYKDPNKPLCLRIKVNTKKDQLLIKLYNSKDQLNSCTEEEFNKYVFHSVKVKCIIQIGDIWTAGGKYGVSYHLNAIRAMPDTNNDIFTNITL